MRGGARRRNHGEHASEASTWGAAAVGSAAAAAELDRRDAMLLLSVHHGGLSVDRTLGLCALLYAVRVRHSRAPAPSPWAFAAYRARVPGASGRDDGAVGCAERAEGTASTRDRYGAIRAGGGH